MPHEFSDHLYWYVLGALWAWPAYFWGKVQAFREARAIFDPLIERVMTGWGESMAILRNFYFALAEDRMPMVDPSKKPEDSKETKH